MNKLIYLLLIVTLAISLNAKNAIKMSEDDAVKYFLENSAYPYSEGISIELIDTTRHEWKIESNCQCKSPDGENYFIFSWDSKKILKGYGLVAGINFEGDRQCLKINAEKRDSASRVAELLITRYVKNVVTTIHRIALQSYKEKSFLTMVGYSINISQCEYWLYYPIDQDNVSFYNDIGFFLEQGEKYWDAVYVLEEVVKAVPDRTVAYINLGDAYFECKQNKITKDRYLKYIDLMKKEGKESKIPKRVFERVK